MNLEIVAQATVAGIGATLTMDIWSLCQRYLFKVPPLQYALVGRLFLGLLRGKVRHNTILTTPPIQAEGLAGWVIHYLTGIAFAFIPVGLTGMGWYHEPEVFTAVFTAFLTLLAPFMILQPALGFGIAAARTPHPWRARLFSALSHLAYGCGLYITALAWVHCAHLS
ncbi:DUF2938 family protein [Pantoea sp. Ae16]|uniref:DUF2938 family protein n=1 Tax=Pantoea sp. Ae16 TaxID=1890373 RepID=UPI0008FD64C6|nr:DUF2938 family protein [Pantoea sp. Ae16]OIX90524.1 hypothetical protein BFS13_10070 [Pantoea sp. Ae16]